VLGPEGALPLLALASASQIAHLLDLESWRRDRFDPLRSGAWVALLVESGEATIRRFARNIDDETLILLFRLWAKVTPLDIDHEEPTKGHGIGDMGDERGFLSPDGAKAAVRHGLSIWIHDLKEKKARLILGDTFPQRDGVLSPDGRWLAYTSEEAGSPQVFVRPFPALDRKWLISTGLGDTPHWRADSRELWYQMRDASGTHMMSVALTAEAGSPNPGTPVNLFTFDPRIVVAVPSADHTRLLAGREVAGGEQKTIRLILDWSAGLKAAGERR